MIELSEAALVAARTAVSGLHSSSRLTSAKRYFALGFSLRKRRRDQRERNRMTHGISSSGLEWRFFARDCLAIQPPAIMRILFLLQNKIDSEPIFPARPRYRPSADSGYRRRWLSDKYRARASGSTRVRARPRWPSGRSKEKAGPEIRTRASSRALCA